MSARGVRRKSFYSWGYEDEGATPEEICGVEWMLGRRFGMTAFDVTPPPRPEEIPLRAPRLPVPDTLASIVSTNHRDRRGHAYGEKW